MAEMTRDPEAIVRIDMIMGRVEIQSWFQPEGDRLVGMGRCVHYDFYGSVVKDETAPTGIVMSWPKPEVSLWRRLLKWIGA